MAKIYAAETPVLEMGRILKNKLSPLRVKLLMYYLTDINSVEVKSKQRNIHLGTYRYYEEYMDGMIHVVE